MDKLSFYELGILETFGGQKGVKRQTILDGSEPDDNEEIVKQLKVMQSKKLLYYYKDSDTFDFAALSYRR